MIANVAFTVPGEPQGKGRARAAIRGNRAVMYTPKKTVSYEGMIGQIAAQAMAGAPLLGGECRIDVEIVFAVPPSWSKKKQQHALSGAIRPRVRPDFDNILKAVCDGINGVVWRDDAQAVEGVWRKRYGHTPGVRVQVAQL